jgi:hypothetical protein
MALRYELLGQVKSARAADLHLPHGTVRTPVFMPGMDALFTYAHLNFFVSFSLRYIHKRSLLFLLFTSLYSHTLTSIHFSRNEGDHKRGII